VSGLSARRELPAKLYYRIGEVAGLVGVEPHVLRYWESEFRSIRPQKSAKGQRVYSRRDVETLLKVKELLYAHRFTIAGARRKLREGGIEPPDEDDPTREQARQMREALLDIRGEIVSIMNELDAPPSPKGATTERAS
jgi:DNA-binding transcriptional MerR regulator